jgi:hypothetical protein
MEKIIIKSLNTFLEDGEYISFPPNLLIAEVQKQIAKQIRKDLQKYLCTKLS